MYRKMLSFMAMSAVLALGSSPLLAGEWKKFAKVDWGSGLGARSDQYAVIWVERVADSVVGGKITVTRTYRDGSSAPLVMSCILDVEDARRLAKTLSEVKPWYSTVRHLVPSSATGSTRVFSLSPRMRVQTIRRDRGAARYPLVSPKMVAFLGLVAKAARQAAESPRFEYSIRKVMANGEMSRGAAVTVTIMQNGTVITRRAAPSIPAEMQDLLDSDAVADFERLVKDAQWGQLPKNLDPAPRPGQFVEASVYYMDGKPRAVVRVKDVHDSVEYRAVIDFVKVVAGVR